MRYRIWKEEFQEITEHVLKHGLPEPVILPVYAIGAFRFSHVS